MENLVYKGKCVIIGDNEVGKTSLISCFVEHKFPKDYLPTIGTNLYVKELQPEKNIIFNLTCWDIAGDRKKWTAMRKLYYNGATAAFIVSDLTRPETFDSIPEYWLPEIRKHCGDIPIIFLANKNDLESRVDPGRIPELASEIGAIGYYFTSAKTSENVNPAFNDLVNAMLERLRK